MRLKSEYQVETGVEWYCNYQDRESERVGVAGGHCPWVASEVDLITQPVDETICSGALAAKVLYDQSAVSLSLL